MPFLLGGSSHPSHEHHSDFVMIKLVQLPHYIYYVRMCLTQKIQFIYQAGKAQKKLFGKLPIFPKLSALVLYQKVE